MVGLHFVELWAGLLVLYSLFIMIVSIYCEASGGLATVVVNDYDPVRTGQNGSPRGLWTLSPQACNVLEALAF